MQSITYNPKENYPTKAIFPRQVHGEKIVEIITGQEDLTDTDGLYSSNPDFLLGVKTADCAPISFISEEKFGIIHVGWRGLCQQICEKMLALFVESSTKIYCGPFLWEFEIQKDDCYQLIVQKFGDRFFKLENEKIIFKFKDAISSVIPNIIFDPRITLTDPALASWRRDHIKISNVTIVGELTDK